MAGVKGMKHRRARTPKDRDGYAAARIEQLLDDIREGKTKADASQLKAMELRYSRLRPMLSAVEQTVTDARDTADPAEIEAKLRALYDAKPELFAFIQPKAAQQVEQKSSAPGEQRVTH